jgi:competence protein ComFC
MHYIKANFTSILKPYFEGFQHLIFPNTCLQCSHELSRFEKHICAFCWDKLQRTYFESYEMASSMDQLFWGRIDLQETFALYFFEKEKPIQEILHALKYQFKAPLGRHFGRIMGETIEQSNKYKEIEALIPVPIHPQKRFLRGYNQSELLAEGMAEVLKIPILMDVVQKKSNNSSQTRKNRFLRWDNASEQFSLGKKAIAYRHVAIVDDVTTTGSTLEAMAQLLRSQYPNLQISLISFAIAK